MKTPKFIYFDMGNVLLHFDHAIAWRQMGKVAGVPAKLVQDVLTAGLLDEYELGAITTRQFHEKFCEQTASQPDLDALVLAASDIFSINTRIVPLVGQLRLAGYPLGVLSNTCPCHWEHVSEGRFGIMKRCFQKFALSYQLRVMKPDARIYAEAARLAGVRPDEMFFVDDLAENVQAARHSGVDAIQFVSAPALAEQLFARGLRFNY